MKLNLEKDEKIIYESKVPVLHRTKNIIGGLLILLILAGVITINIYDNFILDWTSNIIIIALYPLFFLMLVSEINYKLFYTNKRVYGLHFLNPFVLKSIDLAYIKDASVVMFPLVGILNYKRGQINIHSNEPKPFVIVNVYEPYIFERNLKAYIDSLNNLSHDGNSKN